jgi:hypothetical protein
MEEVTDKLVSELGLFKDADSADGGCADILTIEAVYFGDPGVIPVNSYPCFTVQPEMDEPDSETTGYEVRNLRILITLLIDAREYFNASVEEASGDRKLVQTMGLLRAWLRRTANRRMDGLTGVREVAISRTDYLVQVRDDVVAKSAQTNVTVNRQYRREA